MKYKHIMAAVASELWAIEESKLLAIVEFLALQSSGFKLTAAEVEAKIGKQREAEVSSRKGNVAVLPLRGVIANRMSLMSAFSGGASAEGFAAAFQSAMADDAVKAIVIDTDSPGGTVAGTPELAAMIYGARGQKPIVAQVNAQAASAAYWIASAADEIAVTPSGAVGSVGVIWSHQNVSKALARAGVDTTLITSKDAPHKTEGHPFGPLGDEAQAHKQAMVDEAHDRFAKDLARNRNTSQSNVRDNFGRGRMVDADRAVTAGMADRVATMDETLKRFGATLYAPTAQPGIVSRRGAFALEREKRALLLS